MLAANSSERIIGRTPMFHRPVVAHRRTDFLSALVLVVGCAFLLTLAFQAQAGHDRCPPAAADARHETAMLDSATLVNTGAARCRTDSTSASWASAIWGAFTR
jgi:hypothetical protein